MPGLTQTMIQRRLQGQHGRPLVCVHSGLASGVLIGVRSSVLSQPWHTLGYMIIGEVCIGMCSRDVAFAQRHQSVHAGLTQAAARPLQGHHGHRVWV
jgi:hypothetical protein